MEREREGGRERDDQLVLLKTEWISAQI